MLSTRVDEFTVEGLYIERIRRGHLRKFPILQYQNTVFYYLTIAYVDGGSM
jgi:hypothetical protein